jgi:hypothetical protein
MKKTSSFLQKVIDDQKAVRNAIKIGKSLKELEK